VYNVKTNVQILMKFHMSMCLTWLYRVAQKPRTLGVSFILNHVLLNSVTKLSEMLYIVSSKMFAYPAMSCK